MAKPAAVDVFGEAMRYTHLYRNADVLTITTPHGKPRKNGTQPVKISVYLVTEIETHKDVAYPAFKLQKLTGERETWEVHQDAYGVHCSCGDGHFRKENSGEDCKHAASLRVHGYLPPKETYGSHQETQENEVPDKPRA